MLRRRIHILILVGLTICASLQGIFAQGNPQLNSAHQLIVNTLEWQPTQSFISADGKEYQHLYFNDAKLNPETLIPFYFESKAIASNHTSAVVKLKVLAETRLTLAEQNLVKMELTDQYEVNAEVKSSAGRKFLLNSILPLRKQGGVVFKLEQFTLDVSYASATNRGGDRANSWKSESILASGSWAKFYTGMDGIYKVTYSYLSEVGFDLSELVSANVRLYGNPAGMLSLKNSDHRPDDLSEISIQMFDGGDGTFDPGDYFLFYGEDQLTWEKSNFGFKHELNLYADSVAYFVTIDGGMGIAKRINSVPSHSNPNYYSNSYNFYDLHEAEISNLIKSGRQWYGESFGIVREMDFGFFVPEVDRNASARMLAQFAVRSVGIPGSGMSLSMSNQGGISSSKKVDGVPNGYALLYANKGTTTLTFKPTNSNFLTKIALDYGTNSNTIGWLDYIELNARRSLKFLSPLMNFRDTASLGVGRITQFDIAGATKVIRVWDVSNIHSVREIEVLGGVTTGYRFACPTDSLKEFVVFEEQFLQPSAGRIIPTQNLHGYQNIDYIVVSHPSFVAQAQLLADMHAKDDGFVTAVVNVKEIFNEFSGGVEDITAIKEFMRMLYHRATQSGGITPKYLLLMGDASYDYKDRISGNTNLVPSYQSLESLQPTSSVVSDDYFALLDDDEGDSTSDLLDVAVGRLPARTKEEATGMVNKIIKYSRSAETYGDWRNRITLVADDVDKDGTVFMVQSNTMAEIIDTAASEFNVRKLYSDSYRQVSGSGGQRYPDVNKAINESVEKGTLFIYYIGHGGEVGWAHERILEVSDINSWTNIDNLAIFLTATCEFTRFDDPRRTSAGEFVMLNPSGGGAALLTTTRPVFSGPNYDLTKAFTQNAFDFSSTATPRIGDICVKTKIDNASSTTNALNSRCFSLMGDPAMKVAFPKQQIAITSVPDTIRALDKVTVKGVVTDENGAQLVDFNGLLYPVIFDKVAQMQTLNNDGTGTFTYTEQKNILFRGKVSVTKGAFTFQFVVPKDIEKTYGQGKISLYAKSGESDANGAAFNTVIGGFSKNPVTDQEGPDADLFMNDSKFVFGGLTDENPDIYAEIVDESGINMVGSGIGHDITAVLDANSTNTLVLNDYYESDVDSYTSGKIRYNLRDLDEGKHTIKLQVWDVNNNPTDATTEFIVASSEELALDHVLNYPNPFTTNTDFYFEHNKPGQGLDVRIQVFTVSGKLVKTIDGIYSSDGYRVGPINWNGRDDYGDLIGKGVYMYKVDVKTFTGDHAFEFEKLVLLK